MQGCRSKTFALLWSIVKVSAMRIVVFMLLFFSGGLSGKLTISWKEDFLRVNDDRNPGGALEVWYLEAYCRPGSTDREWNETVIDHETKLLSATETEIKLRCQLADGVIIESHLDPQRGIGDDPKQSIKPAVLKQLVTDIEAIWAIKNRTVLAGN